MRPYHNTKRLVLNTRYCIVILGILSGVFIFSCSSGEKPIRPSFSSLTESVYASVTVQPDHLYNVHAAVGGIVEHILVEEGDEVLKGDPLVQITHTHPEINVHNAKLALDLAQRTYRGRSNLLNELKDEIGMAKLRLEDDSVNFVKQRNLWKKNIGTRNAYEARALTFQTSRASLDLLMNRYQRTEDDLKFQLEQAQNNYNIALAANKDYTITSKIDGRVYALLKEPGELVSLQEPVAAIGDARRFIIEMLIDEVDITRIDQGQHVLVTLDAYPQQVFDAFISRIYPRKDEATQTFTVEASFQARPEKLFPGLSGEANIIIKAKEGTLVIPRKYLTDDEQVKTQDGYVTVQTGLISLDKVEILSGIDSTTYLYLPQQ